MKSQNTNCAYSPILILALSQNMLTSEAIQLLMSSCEFHKLSLDLLNWNKVLPALLLNKNVGECNFNLTTWLFCKHTKAYSSHRITFNEINKH